MQIHELNTFTGEVGDNTYLAIDNGTDTSKINASDIVAPLLAPIESDMSVLEARMDSFTNLAEGSTTGDAELIDGRVGADGVTYTNIGGAIRGQVTDLRSDTVQNFTQYEFSIENSRVRPNNGAFVYNTASWRTDYIPCKAGETISYRGQSAWYGGSPIAALLAFYDNDKNFISAVSQFSDSETTNTVGVLSVQAPANTAFVIGGTYDIVGESYIKIRNIQSLIDSIPSLLSDAFGLSPMDFGAKGDGVTVDNVALNAYFKYCYDNGLDADGFGKTYLVDDSTATFTDAETSSVHYGVKAFGARKIQNFNFVLADGVAPLTPCLTVMISDMGATRVEKCSFRGGASTNSGAEDGGNHGILFVKDRMFPSSWQELNNVYVDDCIFIRIWSYGIFLTPINATFRVSNCQFTCGGPAILTYATRSFINNCVYGWTGRAGQIDTLCIDEIENFNNVSTPYKKSIYISNCKSSRQIHHISEQVQRSVIYGNVVIDKCYSDDKIFQTYDVDTEAEPTIVIDNLVIRDSFCGLLSGNSRIITLDHLDGNAVFDNFSYSDNGYSGWVINKSKGNIYLKETKAPTLIEITNSDIEFLKPNYSAVNIG